MISSNKVHEPFAVSSECKEEVIRVENLVKRYANLTAVKKINFSVRQGEIFGLIGPDGAGKTTTFHILSGIAQATAGETLVLGKPPCDARLSIGYLTQQFSLYPDLSIDENLLYSAGLRQVDSQQFARRRIKYLSLMNLLQFSDRLAGQLSGGMKQKLALCCALIFQPKVLLLDEPTTGVDPVSRREFWDVLAAVATEGVTIVVATPYLDEAERCDRIALMYEGSIQQIGTLTELRNNLGLQRLELKTFELELAEKIIGEKISHAETAAQKSTSMVDVQTFGDRLDVLVEDSAKGKSEIRHLFEQHRLKLNKIQVTDPTLENVFVTNLRLAGYEPQFIPFPRVKTPNLTNKEEAAISADKLNKYFGDFHAVKELNLTINYGEIYGLLGANGAGKTTTIKMLCGLVAPTNGTIFLAGQSRNLRSSQLRKKIGYMSQKFTLYDDLTIIQNLEFYCGVYEIPRRLRRRKIDWVLSTCDLIGKETMMTGQLPGGWKQRVAFGASIMHEPEILFLDEPTSGVDPLARRQFWRLINDLARQGTAVLVTTHYLEEAEQCNRMGFMVAGNLVAQGSPSEIKDAQNGQLIEIVTDRTQNASDLLKTEFHPWQISIFGDRLHVVLENPESEIHRVKSLLQTNQINISGLRAIPFSLEDAFIGIVQRAQATEK